MTSLRNRLFPAVAAAFAIGALAVASCSSDNKTSTDTESTTTTVAATTSTAIATTTAASVTTLPATSPPTTAPATTPATNPPPQIITSFSVSNAAACPAVDASFPVDPHVTVSWTVVGADSVNLLIDGGLWQSYGLSGSESLPAACNDGHNVHSYEVDAIKNGQKIASKKATRGS